MYDPGNIYAIGFAMMFAFAAGVMFFARRNLEKNGEASALGNKPIIALASASLLMLGAVGIKVILFADFYAHTMYAPI